VQTLLKTIIAMGCILAAADGVSAAEDRAKAGKGQAEWEPAPGYKYRSIDGFHLAVNKAVLEENERSTLARKPMDVLQLELDLLLHDLPQRAIAVLRDIPIWVEWDVVKEIPSADKKINRATAVYHPGNTQLRRYSYSSFESLVKSNAVEILSMRLLSAEHQGTRHRCMLLHEMTHAVHHHLFDYENPIIKSAYDSAMSKGLFAGQYAATNHKEYFAELSCAYFGHLGYPPRTREDLKKYDPTGYHMMELTWGTPESLARELKAEHEKLAAPKLANARRLLMQKNKRAEAITLIEAVIKDYPETKIAAEAQKVLAKAQSAPTKPPVKPPAETVRP
jgi:hypothetical protein